MRAEGDCQPQRPSACQQRSDIDPHFREQDHHGDGADDHRQRVAKQRQQRSCPGTGQRTAVNIRGEAVLYQAGEQRPADGGEEQDQRDADNHIHCLLPGAVMYPVPEIEQPPGAEQQHNGDGDHQNARHLQRHGDPAVEPLLQLRIAALGLRRQGDGFGYPARQNAGDQRRGADDRQAAHRGAHHKFQAVARVK